MQLKALVADELGCRGCHHCRLVFRVPDGVGTYRCPRCDEKSHYRKPASEQRTLALLATAIVLFIPANLLPVFETTTLGVQQDHTIVSGVVELAKGGSWELALIVFIASIVVPIFKMGALALLVVMTRLRRSAHIQPYAKLYRVVESIGHWSMLDIFVIALLVALVQFGSIATIAPAGGAVAFGAVVILTMLASACFDPRLLWDRTGDVAPSEQSRP